MRITRMYVNGFGALYDKTFELNKPVTIFYGLNEAGKSTLLGFIRAVLFGFPTRQQSALRYEPIAGGAHGGAIYLHDEHRGIVRVERYEGTFNKANNGYRGFQLTLEDGSAAGEELLKAMMGGLTPGLFRSLFAFGLSELQEIRTLQSEELGEYLFNAGMGAGAHKVLRAEQWMKQEMEQLYKPRGTKQEINKLLHAIEQAEAGVRLQKEETGRFNELLQEERDLDRFIDRMEAELERNRAQLNWNERCRSARERWLRWREISREIGELPVFLSFPEDPLTRYEVLRDERDRLQSENAALQRQAEQIQAHLRSTRFHERFIESKSRVDGLLERVGFYRDGLQEASALQAEINSWDKQIQDVLRRIDNSWQTDQLESFPVTVAVNETVRRFQSAHVELEAEQRRLQGELERIHRQAAAEKEQADRLQLEAARLKRQAETDANLLADSDTETLSIGVNRLRQRYEAWKREQLECEYIKRSVEDLHYSVEGLQQLGENSSGRMGARRNSLTGPARWLRRLLPFGVISAILLPVVWWGLSGDALSSAAGFIVLASANIYLYAQYRSIRRKLDYAGQSGTASETPSASLAALALRQTERIAAAEKELQERMNRLLESQRELSEAFLRLTACQEAAAALTGIHRPESRPIETVGEIDSYTNHHTRAARSFGTGEESAVIRFSFPLSDELFVSLQQLLEKKRKHERESETLQHAQEELAARSQRALEERKQTENRLREADSAAAEWRMEWKEWLLAQQLDMGLSPESAAEMIRYIEQGQQWLLQKRKAESRRSLLTDARRLFESEVAALMREFMGADRTATTAVDVEAASTDAFDAALSLKLLKAEVEAQEQSMREKQQELQRLEELRDRKQELEWSMQRAEERMVSLWREANAENEEIFRKHVREHAERHRLLEEKRQLEVYLETVAGREQVEELAITLERDDDHLLSEQIERLEERYILLRDELNKARERKGRLQHEIQKLTTGHEHAEQLQQLEEQAAAFQQQARRWAVLAVCAELIRRTRSVVEKESQPAVLRRASEYFRDITGGRYVRVMVPLGGKNIVVENEQGTPLDVSRLSRGTAEQLYLAMRFALADEYAGNSSLPVIMDDIFVNFDRQRLESMLPVLSQVAQRHQIILFTCHSHVVEAVKKSGLDYECISLER